MGKAYFITATGTDAGKTFVAEGLARALHARGQGVKVLKPVMSGYDPTQPASSDAGRLLAACGLPVDAAAVAAISPWRFAAPLSPDRAAVVEGKSIDVVALIDWCRAVASASPDDTLLIEGVGGVMVPLDARHTVRDWIAALALPTLLVAGTYLGAISHTLSALAALREVGVCPEAIVLNESAGGIGLADTVASLAPHVGAIRLLELRRGTPDDVERIAVSLLLSQ